MSNLEDLVLRHLGSVETRIKSLSKQKSGSAAFGLACCERVYPVYARAASGRSWDISVVIRQSLNDAWLAILGGTQFVPRTAAGYGTIVPPDGSFDGDDETAAWSVALALADFFEMVMIRGDQSHSNYTASSVFDTLELLADIIERDRMRRLVHDEIRRQEDDLEALEKKAAAETINAIRRRSEVCDVFGGYWFTH